MDDRLMHGSRCEPRRGGRRPSRAGPTDRSPVGRQRDCRRRVFQTDFWHIAEAMAHKKPNLPEKICVVCGRPFKWRKKWAEVWSEVKYCSEKCRKKRDKKDTQS